METLAAAAMSLLAPSPPQGAEQFAGEAGKGAADAVPAIAEQLHSDRGRRSPVRCRSSAVRFRLDPAKSTFILAGLLYERPPA